MFSLSQDVPYMTDAGHLQSPKVLAAIPGYEIKEKKRKKEKNRAAGNMPWCHVLLCYEYSERDVEKQLPGHVASQLGR